MANIKDIEGIGPAYGEKLEAAGYPQYEVSNYARAGKACLHNLHTWQMHEWIGYGPSASSQYEGRRFTEIDNLDQWTASVQNRTPHYSEDIKLDSRILASDALVFGLRMNAGIDPKALEERFPGEHWSALHQLCAHLNEEGLLTTSDANWTLTPRGRLVADAVGAAVLQALETK